MYNACSIGLEGVVSKVRDSRYISGGANSWVKKTCAQRETLPVAGFALKQNKFDGIYVGRRRGKDLVYAGKIDHGFDTASAKEMQTRLWRLGSSNHSRPKSNTAPSRPRAKWGIRFSRACGRICNENDDRIRRIAARAPAA
jgi:ATP-dependent DNA ligase